jgi:hypothetical protein
MVTALLVYPVTGRHGLVVGMNGQGELCARLLDATTDGFHMEHFPNLPDAADTVWEAFRTAAALRMAKMDLGQRVDCPVCGQQVPLVGDREHDVVRRAGVVLVTRCDGVV